MACVETAMRRAAKAKTGGQGPGALREDGAVSGTPRRRSRACRRWRSSVCVKEAPQWRTEEMAAGPVATVT